MTKPTLILSIDSPPSFKIDTINFFTSAPSIQPFIIKEVHLPSYINSFINFENPKHIDFNSFNSVFTDNRFPLSSFLISSNKLKLLHSLLSHDPLSAIQGLNNNTYTLLNFAFIQKSSKAISIIIKLLRKKTSFSFLLTNSYLKKNFSFLSKSTQSIILKLFKKLSKHFLLTLPIYQDFFIHIFLNTSLSKSKSKLASLISSNNPAIVSLINHSIYSFHINSLNTLLNKINYLPSHSHHYYQAPLINAIQSNNLPAIQLIIFYNHFPLPSSSFQNPLMTALEYYSFNTYYNKDIIPTLINFFPQLLLSSSTIGYKLTQNSPRLFNALESACHYNNIQFIYSYFQSLHLSHYAFSLLLPHYQNNPHKIFNWWSSLKFAQIIDSFLICLTKIDNNIDNQSQNSFFKNANHHINAFQDLIPIIFDFFLDYY